VSGHGGGWQELGDGEVLVVDTRSGPAPQDHAREALARGVPARP
jgi:hypothetical protein